MIPGADLDHVALAAEERAALARRYVGELGGRPGPEGPSRGFHWAQVEYANGMVLEMLEPHHPEENDFLRRFLDRNGPGPHHLTFKVADFAEALGAAEAAGYNPVGVDTSDPNWKEAFLHPKDAPGVVVQLAESHEDHEEHDPAPPVPGGPQPAELLYVGHAVRHMQDGLRLFEDLLGGRRTGEGTADDHRFVDLAWPGPGRIRLAAPTCPGPVDAWLGGRPGRIHHIAFRVADPERVAGATRQDGVWRVEPHDNLGTRLVLLGEDG